MEISAEKTTLMKFSANGIQREIKVKWQNLGTVTSFKYLPRSSCFRRWLKTRDSHEDFARHCSSYKAEAN